jgi:hypothetical protein
LLLPLVNWAPALQGVVAGVAVLGILIWSGKPPTPFIYFQF